MPHVIRNLPFFERRTAVELRGRSIRISPDLIVFWISVAEWGLTTNLPTSKSDALRQISQRSQQWLRWYEGLEAAEEISVDDLPDEVQKQLKAAVRAIRKLEETATQVD